MKIILTGATGFVGEGILLACLDRPEVEKVLSVSRRPCEISHPKLEEYIVEDFMTLPVDDPKLQGYDACFFCAGKSNIGMSKDEMEYLRRACEKISDEELPDDMWATVEKIYDETVNS